MIPPEELAVVLAVQRLRIAEVDRAPLHVVAARRLVAEAAIAALAASASVEVVRDAVEMGERMADRVPA